MTHSTGNDTTTPQTTPIEADGTFTAAPGRARFEKPPRVLIIGAGSRGTAYAKSARNSTNAIIAAVCEPIAYKRAEFGRKFIWGTKEPAPEQQFEDWKQWVKFEETRRKRVQAGEKVREKGIDAVFVCVLDEMHEEVVCGIAALGVSICCEKPLATSLESCMAIYRALKSAAGKDVSGGSNGDADGHVKTREPIFGICHVLRYSQHNMMLRHLVLEQEVIGDVLSIEHVEPVGWWHFSHSYVRGNWRKESTTAPSLLTKSCHDIDFLMWMLSTPAKGNGEPHLPSHLTSTGSRKFFRKERKPIAAGAATNCLSCPHEKDCDYSAKKIYLERQLLSGNTGWPVKIVNPEIEECYKSAGVKAASKMLLKDLREDYDSDTLVNEIESRPWYGRCVWEADNDVCDDQCVTITWDDDPIANDKDGRPILKQRGAKTAQFHMIAFTEKICARRGRIYGTKGEIEYDSSRIKVHNFSTGYTRVHRPHVASGGHGGGDEGLARQFLQAVNAVDHHAMPAAEAQRKYLGCDLDEAFRSHAMVFAAEEARKERKVVDWKQWWEDEVEKQLHQR
ncbi:streptomycin biosynthesis protein StrI [Amniculicola lignicola CBS 123094]|uniref:Streptomycin biosynthesis protein StrI n=1 Tax=Amniculicola lignicola CBS 123094 TaxID=1392246 RepID=A0A6A5X0X6_9PLEO|nr:streptomycin biosynthesis protein StrI [Amniculicola lignicola CBS 123094]